MILYLKEIYFDVLDLAYDCRSYFKYVNLIQKKKKKKVNISLHEIHNFRFGMYQNNGTKQAKKIDVLVNYPP